MKSVDQTIKNSTLSDQLRKLVENAEKIRSEQFQAFKDDLSRKLLRLRPSVNGISAVSCCEDTPQLGFTNISPRNVEAILEKPLSPPKRATPEKQLQSWLIQQALRSNGRLELLDHILGGQYLFVSDEIALKTASEKVVADLLLVRIDSDGLASLVNAELKSKRAMETFRQVLCFRKALDHPDLQNGWKKFAEVMTGQDFQWNPSPEANGIVIWPAVGEKQKNVRANEKRKAFPRVDVVGYQFDSGAKEYSFQSEPFGHDTISLS